MDLIVMGRCYRHWGISLAFIKNAEGSLTFPGLG